MYGQKSTFSKAKLLHAVTVRLKDSYTVYPFGENVYLMTVQMLLMGVNLELIELLKRLIV